MPAMQDRNDSVLLITQCSDPLKWYSIFIGKYVPLIAAEGTEYRSQEPAGYTNFVSYLDAVVVDLTDNIQYY
jgi:hypothetical protein